jgi:U3 small nucleolar RNA-associated protein 19
LPSQLFETEASRQIRHPPALAPVPKRQPIGDSFFPKPVEAKPAEDVEMAEDEDVDPDAGAPVDLVSAMWTF